MRALKIHLIPYSLRTKYGTIRLSPTFTCINVNAKKLGVKLIKMDVPDKDTFIIHSGFGDAPLVVSAIIKAHAELYECKAIIEASDFLNNIEALTDTQQRKLIEMGLSNNNVVFEKVNSNSTKETFERNAKLEKLTIVMMARLSELESTLQKAKGILNEDYKV